MQSRATRSPPHGPTPSAQSGSIVCSSAGTSGASLSAAFVRIHPACSIALEFAPRPSSKRGASTNQNCFENSYRFSPAQETLPDRSAWYFQGRCRRCLAITEPAETHRPDACRTCLVSMSSPLALRLERSRKARALNGIRTFSSIRQTSPTMVRMFSKVSKQSSSRRIAERLITSSSTGIVESSAPSGSNGMSGRRANNSIISGNESSAGR